MLGKDSRCHIGYLVGLFMLFSYTWYLYCAKGKTRLQFCLFIWLWIKCRLLAGLQWIILRKWITAAVKACQNSWPRNSFRQLFSLQTYRWNQRSLLPPHKSCSLTAIRHRIFTIRGAQLNAAFVVLSRHLTIISPLNSKWGSKEEKTEEVRMSGGSHWWSARF